MLGDVEEKGLGQDPATIVSAASTGLSLTKIVTGLFGGLFGGKAQHPEAGIAFHYGLGRTDFPGAGWQAALANGSEGTYEVYYKNINITSVQQLADLWRDISEKLKTTLIQSGKDTSGFKQDWGSYIGKLDGQSIQTVVSALQQKIIEYLQFASKLSLQEVQAFISTTPGMITVPTTQATVQSTSYTPASYGVTQPVTQASMFSSIPTWAWILVAFIGVTSLTGSFVKKYY